MAVATAHQLHAALADARRKKFRLLAAYYRFGGEAIAARASHPAFLVGVTSRLHELWLAREPDHAARLEKFPVLIVVLGMDEPRLDKAQSMKSLANALDAYLGNDRSERKFEGDAYVLHALVADQESFDNLAADLNAVGAKFPKRALERPPSPEAIAAQLEHALARGQANLAAEAEAALTGHAGFEPATEAEGQAFVQRVNELLQSQGLALRFPSSTAPAVLAYKTLGRYRKCHFVLSEADQRDEFINCGVKLPRLHVMAVPARQAAAERHLVRNIVSLRRRLREVAAQSGLSLTEIGERMGIDPQTLPKTRVWWLMNRSENPPIFQLLKFCEATKTRIEDLLAD